MGCCTGTKTTLLIGSGKLRRPVVRHQLPAFSIVQQASVIKKNTGLGLVPGVTEHWRTPLLSRLRSRNTCQFRKASAGEYKANSSTSTSTFTLTDTCDEGTSWERLVSLLQRIWRQADVQKAIQATQFGSSVLFVLLYVWSTYSTPAVFSARYNLDLFLCAAFACDYAIRLAASDSKWQTVADIWNVLDILSFLPPLLEAAAQAMSIPLSFGGLDLRWFKILRAMRVMRVTLLAGQLQKMQAMHVNSSGALLSGAASVRLFQMVASVLTLLFTATSIVQLVERVPWLDALYFVITTMTTVGYGDVVARTKLGKITVLAMILIGAVLIPVQSSQVYSQFAARRVTLGSPPEKKMPTVLVSTRLTEVRGFGDFFTEFTQALKESTDLPRKMRMVVLGNKPSYQFRAFQELNEKTITIMEGSALSEADLIRTRADHALAALLLADRFAPNAKEEDLDIQFQVWALKSYTKTVGLYVQVVQRASVGLVAPFLNPERDVIVSIEQTRHRMLALSCLCPGASTLIGNLLRTAKVHPSAGLQKTAAGRRWLRSYINGCAFKVFEARVGPSLAGCTFLEASEWLFRSSSFALIGLRLSRGLVLNPGSRMLQGDEVALVVATSQAALDVAMQGTYEPLVASFLGKGLHPSMDYEPWPDEENTEKLGQLPRAFPIESDSYDDADHRDDRESSERVSASSLNHHESSSNGASGGVQNGAGENGAASRRHHPVATGFKQPSSWNVASTSGGRGTHPNRGGEESWRNLDRWVATATVYSSGDDGGRKLEAQRERVAARAGPSGRDPDAEEREPGLAERERRRRDFERARASATATTDEHDDFQWMENGGFRRDRMWNHPAQTLNLHTRQPEEDSPVVEGRLRGHIIMCGAEEGFAALLDQLRRCDPSPTPIVVLHPHRPANWQLLEQHGPVHFVQGEPSVVGALRTARASSARALVFLGNPQAHQSSSSASPSDAYQDGNVGARAPVLADAPALLTCYGVAEEGGAAGVHSVVELCYTSSVRFLNPGLLLRGSRFSDDLALQQPPPTSGPRRSWLMRKRQERKARKEGLTEWQVNPYYAAGRVTVPALMDTFACQCFFSKGMLPDLMTELCGDDGRYGGAILRQIRLPLELVGKTYGELYSRLALVQGLIPLGLYRRKTENPSSRLHYVVTNPSPQEELEPGDRIFVLIQRRYARPDAEAPTFCAEQERIADSKGNVAEKEEVCYPHWAAPLQH